MKTRCEYQVLIEMRNLSIAQAMNASHFFSKAGLQGQPINGPRNHKLKREP